MLHNSYTAHPTDPTGQDLHTIGFIVDAFADLATITTWQEGMTAFVRATNLLYIVDAVGGWHIVSTAGTGFDWQESVLSIQTTPPGSPTPGDRYLIGPVGATGAWTGFENYITFWDGTDWVFNGPSEGWVVFVEDTNRIWVYHDGAWSLLDTSPLTTKGDLYTYSTGPDRLAVGSDNQLLVADAATATGLKWAFIDLSTTMVTGTLPILRGGTGQTTALAAFNALSPLTTRGDLLTRDTTNNIRLAVGVANRVLRSDGTDPSWAQVALSTDVTGTLSATNGGTGTATTTQGDLLYGAAGNTWAKLAKNASATRYLSNTGTSNDPAWAQVNLTNGVTGTLPFGNGGTGLSTLGSANHPLKVNNAGTALEYDPNTAIIDGGSGATVIKNTGGGEFRFRDNSDFDFMAYEYGAGAFNLTGPNVVTLSAGGSLAFYIGGGTIETYRSIRFSSVTAPGSADAGEFYIFKETGVANLLGALGEDDIKKYFRMDKTMSWYADQFETPNSANWTVNANAPISADSLNAGLIEAQFAEGTEQGVGLSFQVPSWATRVTFHWLGRAQAAGGGGVQFTYYSRSILDNAAPSAWSGATNFTALTIPANTNWQYDSQTITLATLGFTAGSEYQMEITRRGSQAGDTLTGNFNLRRLVLEFT